MGIIKNIGNSIIDTVNSLLADSGEWAASVLNQGFKTYNKFINFGFSLITKDIQENDFFKAFWDVIDFLNDVCVIIGSTLLLAFFLYSFINTVVNTPRREVNVDSIIFEFVKLIFCNFLLTHALDVVVAIFTFGTKLAAVTVNAVGGQGIPGANQGLNEDVEFVLTNGVSGILGLLAVIMAIIGAVALIACAVGVLMQIVVRFFKMFALIPFSALTFSAAVMSDGNGNEIYKGYLKSLIALSLEAAVIILCLLMSASISNGGLTTSNSMMGELFDVEEDINFQTVTLDNADEVEKFEDYAELKSLLFKTSKFMSSNLNIEDSNNNIPDKIKALNDFSSYQVVAKNGCKYVGSSGTPTGGIASGISNINPYEYIYPVEGQVCKNLSLGGILALIVQILFPALVSALVVKETPTISRHLVGM